jgi:hypothetical protein
MARASVYAFMSLGIKNIVIWNRTLSRAELMVTNYTKYISGLIASGSLRKTKFRILENLTDPWPADMKQPSVVVCTPPAHNIGDVPGLDFTIPSQWFGSPTGGVIVEVSLRIPRKAGNNLTERASYPTSRSIRPSCVKHTKVPTKAGWLSSLSNYLLSRAALNLSSSLVGLHQGTR